MLDAITGATKMMNKRNFLTLLGISPIAAMPDLLPQCVSGSTNTRGIP